MRADGNELVIRVVRPAPDLLPRLATPWLCAVPPETPDTLRGDTVIPSAGPYYVASHEPGESVVLRRNPGYAGEHPNGFEEIHYELGVAPERAVARVESGEADYYTNAVFGNEIGPEEQERLAARYGAGSPAAAEDRRRFFVVPELSVYYLLFNTNRAPFDDARLRRAVSFAIDRRAMAREILPGTSGLPTDQYVPPGMAGFKDAAIYPLGSPNVKRARELAGDARRSATLYVCNLPTCGEFAAIVRANLGAIGIEVEVRRFSISNLFERIEDPDEPFDIVQYGYAVDFADPFNFINSQFGAAKLPPRYFEDPAYDRRMDAAAQLTGAAREEAYARLDRELATRQAPAAAYASGTTAHFFSERIGCQVAQPVWGIDLGALCVRD